MRYCRKIHRMNTDSLTKQTGLKTHVKNTVMFGLRANGAKSSGKRMRTMELDIRPPSETPVGVAGLCCHFTPGEFLVYLVKRLWQHCIGWRSLRVSSGLLTSVPVQAV